MTDVFPSLFVAVIEDDRAQVKALLKRDPALAMGGLEGEERYEPTLTHWFYKGDTVLHVAAAGYRVEIARMLMEAGADVASAKNRRCSQPLHYAADGHQESPSWNPARQVAMLQLLLEAGAPMNAQDKNGASPLHRAVRTRCATAVKCLIEAGADPAIWNKPGSTAFHLAVQNTGRGGSGSDAARTAQREIIEAFLERGVSPALTDAKGKSVLEWAKSGWIREMLA